MSYPLVRALARKAGLIGLLIALLGSGQATAADPVARAVLFFSPSCPHCHMVMEQVLPPLQAHYGTQLQILSVDVTQPDGQALYQTMVATFGLGEGRLGVPALVFGQEVMVGSEEIPARLPALIVAALSAGGNDWPAIPGIEAWLDAEESLAAPASAPTPSPFLRDPLANSFAVAVLLIMIGSALAVLFTLRTPLARPLAPWQDRSILALASAGMAVALYLAFVEISRSQAVCGPVGDCNTVQQSPYARLFGVLPIGLLGVAGYATILLAWGLRRAEGEVGRLAASALPALAFLGTSFSIYLTFLEPFVIGATCIWCLTSAVLMTALLWITAPRGAPAVRRGRGRRAGAP